MRFSFTVAILALFLLLGGRSPSAPSSSRQIEHQLTIVHPGDADAKPMPQTLVQTLDKEGEPSAYSMWVDSVICRDEVCDVVKVRLHWDALGRYQRYEVAFGSKLTKLDHVPFTDADLAKLQRILADPESPLREVEKESMTRKPPPGKTKSTASVDGVTGATVLTLKNAVIIGAGYTCYDLWHWSNGLLTNNIRDSTGRDSTEEKLRAYLAGEDIDGALLALEYFRKRKIADPASLDAIIDRNREGDKALIAPTLAYLEASAPTGKARAGAILKLFSASSEKKRILILEQLAADTRKPAPGFYDQLAAYLPSLESFFEVHLFLDLMEKHNSSSAVVSRKAVELLSHKKFFVARRAYWHLEKQSLPPDLQKQVDAFHAEHGDRLGPSPR